MNTQNKLEKQVSMIARQVEHGFDHADDTEDPIMEFLESVLDIEWIVASDKQTLLGARLLVASGGPNIWIDTRRGIVEGKWWINSARESFDYCTENATDLHETLETLWNC